MKNEIPLIIDKMLRWCDEGVISFLTPELSPCVDLVKFAYVKNASLLFTLKNSSNLTKILNKSKYYSLAIDIIEIENPSKNTGLMVEGIVKEKLNLVGKLENHIQKLIQNKDSIIYRTEMKKAVAWQGPFFKRWKAK